MLTIWGRDTSINVQKVLWACAELDLEYERMDVGGSFGGLDDSEYRSLNPNGVIPTFRDGDLVLWESNAIVRYLAITYGDGGLCPRDSKARGFADMWMDWQLTTLWPPLRTIFLQLLRTPSAERNIRAVDSARVAASAEFAILNAWLDCRSFVAGDQFTMGDIPVGVAAHRWYYLDIERPELPALKSWYERLAAGSAFAEFVTL